MENELIEVVDKLGSKGNVIKLDNVPYMDCDEYDIFDEKDFKKYRDDIEKSVRTSMEYKEFILYLRNYMDMNRCALFQNVTNITTTKIKIELHHFPFQLSEITVIVYLKRSAYNESLERELVAKEVMYLHYFLYIGLIPLAQTSHELMHNNIVFVPLDKVLGNYQKFIEQYEKFIPSDIMDKFHNYEAMTRVYNSEQNRKVLEVAPVYLKINDGDIGTYKLPQLENVLGLMGDKLGELQDRQPKGILVDPYYKDPTFDDSTKIVEDGMVRPFTILK